VVDRRFPVRPIPSTRVAHMMSGSARWVLGGIWAVVCGAVTAPRPALPADFSRDVQPLLARRCIACHGPDTQEAGLRLDDRARATAALDSGATAVVPGDAAASAVMARITSDDPDLRMPPEGAALSTAEVAVMRDWIEAGAEWQAHWAFRPVVRPGVTGSIDVFIDAGLAARGLPRTPEADKATLLRRVTYGVTGLPPSAADMRDFLADDSPSAWEKVVDRLLASPHYGEHWARHWLDLVRFAETNSFERDGAKPHAWRYRDYVIRSLNDDKPYDRFVIEQLAGDELEEVTNDALVATGYYRLGLWDDEPADRLQARYDGLDDIVSTTSQVFLGLTLNCARCHDHKIDPLPQRDYYAMLAFFHNLTPMGNGGDQIERPLFDGPDARRTYEEKTADLERRRDEAQAAVTAVEHRFREALRREASGPAGGDLDDLTFRFYRDAWRSLPAFDDLKHEDEGPLPGGLFDIAAAPSLRPDNFGYVFTGFLKVPADGDYTFSLDSDDGSRLTIDGRAVLEYDGIHGEGSPKTATVRLASGRRTIRLDYFQGHHGKGLTVGWSGPGFERRLLSAVSTAGRDVTRDLARAIRAEGERVLGAEAMRDYNERVKALEQLKKERVPVDKALVVTEHGPSAPETFVFYRGNPHAEPDAANRVVPAFPAILAPPAPAITPPASGRSTGRRMALARWITAPDNPLTARVIANRVWQHHFGRGIVRSASNFGLMGDPPTHPELLDWLAGELVAGGWRLKALHKTILMSRAYRAASTGIPEGLARDPLNDAFWRFDMRRLTAEQLRDSVLVASGAFNPKMFGPSIYPTMPQAVLATQSRPGSGWGDSPAAEQARRSIYIHVKRSLLTPLLADFDLADPDSSCPVRFTTTQPTQALGMMNGDFLHAQARRFAERVRREAGGTNADQDAAMVRRAIEVALVRPATDAEVARGVALIDDLERTDGVAPGRALELFCLLLLNTNEFAYLD
jgi:mono/diheme cytochrome c family protein